MHVMRVADMASRWREHGTVLAILPRWFVPAWSPVELLARPSFRIASTGSFTAIEAIEAALNPASKFHRPASERRR
jgi:hypothetical protein